jgi:hypothetical protein
MTRTVATVDELTFIPVGSHNSGLAISTATTLTTPAGATKLMIQTLTQNVRFTMDGTVPTATVGFQMMAGDPPIILPVGSYNAVKVIQEDATASMQYQFGR